MLTNLNAESPILLVEPDVDLREALVEGVRGDGMTVAVCASPMEALAWLDCGLVPAVLVTPIAPGVEESALVIRSRLRWPRLDVVFTGPPCERITLRGAYHLAAPFTAEKLSRFLRLVVARPALRGVLQTRYRAAHKPAPKVRPSVERVR